MFVDSDHDSSSSKDSSLQTWVSWFCSLAGNEYYIEVPEEFMDDDFNLTGLSSQVPYYEEALELILDIDTELYEEQDNDDNPPAKSPSPDLDQPDDGFLDERPLKPKQGGRVSLSVLEPYAIMLYGLIHQRYLLTRAGIRFMAERYASQDFGTCPRVHCGHASVLPIGRFDQAGKESVKLYCPCCLDIYNPPKALYLGVDGAHFGTTYAHLMLETYPGLVPPGRPRIYQPKIFGFNVSGLSEAGPHMQWLRQRPPEYLEEDDGLDDDDSPVMDDEDEDEDEQISYEQQLHQVS
ncbi:casein kinase II beta subunit [Hesseltinella vesiculosa]|uniref:Casein kinase II subunit beta n=1 Tax=Hesseltinella vesiculosa TaxID=101127 RepID=A0A1X2GXJ7_9FUNG|nr:casein kinase II beta subunit [Hesseltinella vesiculosa]